MYNVNLISNFVIFVDKSVTFIKMQRILLKFLLNLEKFYAVTILSYGLSKCNRLFLHLEEEIQLKGSPA